MKKLLVMITLITPIAAMAGDDVGNICASLVPDITSNYNVTNLELMSQDVLINSWVSCIYRADVQGLYGDTPTIVTATFNPSNNRFTVTIR